MCAGDYFDYLLMTISAKKTSADASYADVRLATAVFSWMEAVLHRRR